MQDININTPGNYTGTTQTFVTQPFLPELEEFLPYLQEIWYSRQLTNHGPFHNRFESELTAYLGVAGISLCSNATLALILALKSLGIKGEVITTPFSFVATSHAIWWNGLTPVFADIDYATGNIDPASVEKCITSHTAAILPVHVYGNPCDVEALQALADRHNLPVIYDAAHAFGVQHNGTSVLNYGDLSVLSFHATKSFTTFEGGAIACKSAAVKEKLHLLGNFGIADESVVIGTGLNAKMDEFKAALGIVQLRHFQESVRKREQIARIYQDELSSVEGIRIIAPNPFNYSYFPVVFTAVNGISARDAVYTHLRNNGIHARQYFYPLLSNLDVYSPLPSAAPGLLPFANKLSSEVLCLPIYPMLPPETAVHIAHAIKAVLR